MCLYIRDSVLPLSYIIIPFFYVLYIPFAVNLQHSGTICIPTIASVFVSSALAFTELLFGFLSVCKTVYNCFLTKTRYLCPDELI